VRDSFVGEGFEPGALRVWRTRYTGALRDEVDARAAIGALIASLDDPYTRLRSPGEAMARLETVRGVDLLADPRGRVAPGSPTVLSRVLDEGVLYLRLTNLEDATVAEQVEAVLASSPDAPQVILDLRGNPGGYEHLAEEVAGLLAPVEGPLRMQEARDGRSPGTPRAPGRGSERRLKVLVDGGTASAAEHCLRPWGRKAWNVVVRPPKARRPAPLSSRMDGRCS
jgi:C-terminal processing protease CtpA/Prc